MKILFWLLKKIKIYFKIYWKLIFINKNNNIKNYSRTQNTLLKILTIVFKIMMKIIYKIKIIIQINDNCLKYCQKKIIKLKKKFIKINKIIFN